MLILSNNNDWVIKNDKWNWFHWTVLKLLVFKEEYFWAQYYLKCININITNCDDYK